MAPATPSLEPVARAVQRLRTIGGLAVLAGCLALAWWPVFWWMRPVPPPGATSEWTMEWTLWIEGGLHGRIPAALAVAGTLCGPTCALAGGLLLLDRCRRAPAHAGRAAVIVAVASALTLLTATWISIDWNWHATWPDGHHENEGLNLSGGPCLAPLHLIVLGMSLLGALRAAPLLRAEAPMTQGE